MTQRMKGASDEGGCAVALVLGAKVLEGGVASAALERRARHAAHLWLAGQVSRVVASGAERWHPPSEASVIAEILVGCGVPEEVIVLEEQARTTEDNLRFAKPVLERLGASEVWIVTDKAHGPRARLVARRMGLVAQVSAPAPPRWSRARLRVTVRETVALGWYWLRGRGR